MTQQVKNSCCANLTIHIYSPDPTMEGKPQLSTERCLLTPHVYCGL